MLIYNAFGRLAVVSKDTYLTVSFIWPVCNWAIFSHAWQLILNCSELTYVYAPKLIVYFVGLLWHNYISSPILNLNFCSIWTILEKFLHCLSVAIVLLQGCGCALENNFLSKNSFMLFYHYTGDDNNHNSHACMAYNILITNTNYL